MQSSPLGLFGPPLPVPFRFSFPSSGAGSQTNLDSVFPKTEAKSKGAKCTTCTTFSVTGTARYMCLVCKELKLCEQCFESKCCNEQHRSFHPVQPIVPQKQLYGFSRIFADLSLFCCALCGDKRFKIDGLIEHCQKFHANCPQLVHCPVCVTFGTPREQLNGDGRVRLLQHLRAEHKFSEAKMACSMCGQGTNDGNKFACLICEKHQLCEACHESKVYSEQHMPYHPMQLVQPIETLRAALAPPVVASGSKAPDGPRELRIFCCPYCGETDFTIPGLAQHCQELHQKDVHMVRCPVCAVLRVPIKESSLLEGRLLEHLGEYHCSLEVAGVAAEG